MPIYDFTCPNCKHKECDKIVKKAEEKPVCPKCYNIMEKIPFSGINCLGFSGDLPGINIQREREKRKSD